MKYETVLKRIETSYVKGDRISALTDDVLLQIMSSLKLKDVVATSLLSKRWRNIWAEFPILSFCHVGVEDWESFVLFLNRLLRLRQSLKIQEIHIRLNYMKSFSSDVDGWLQIATKKNLEEISVLFNDNWDTIMEGIDFYVLPHCVLNNPTLVKLSLSRCAIKHPQAIHWKSLKVLSLSGLSLTNDLIGHILSVTPALEVFNLRYCYQYDFIGITSKRLRKLVIHNHYDCNSNNLDPINVLSISAPYVQSLEISGHLDLSNSLLIDSPSVIDANISFSTVNYNPIIHDFSEEYPTVLKKVLAKLSNVKCLMLEETCLQALLLLDQTQLPSPFSNLACLCIGPELGEWELPRTTRFLELTPVLETLVFKMESRMVGWFEPKDFPESLHWQSQKRFLAPMLLTLLTLLKLLVLDTMKLRLKLCCSC